MSEWNLCPSVSTFAPQTEQAESQSSFDVIPARKTKRLLLPKTNTEDVRVRGEECDSPCTPGEKPMTVIDLTTDDGIVTGLTEIFNIAYPDWTVSGENRPVSQSDVTFKKGLKSAFAKFGASTSGSLLFSIHKQKWLSNETEWRLMVYLHEISHAKAPGRGFQEKQPGHPPLFWEWVAKNFNRVLANRERIEDLFGEIDWDTVRSELISDVSMSSVDLRSENPYERRKALASQIQYEEDIHPFEGIRLYKNSQIREPDVAMKHPEVEMTDGLTSIRIGDINTSPLPVDDVEEWFNGRNRDCLRYDSSVKSYYIEPIAVSECNQNNSKGNVYNIEMGREAYSLYYHSREDNYNITNKHLHCYIV